MIRTEMADFPVDCIFFARTQIGVKLALEGCQGCHKGRLGGCGKVPKQSGKQTDGYQNSARAIQTASPYNERERWCVCGVKMKAAKPARAIPKEARCQPRVRTFSHPGRFCCRTCFSSTASRGTQPYQIVQSQQLLLSVCRCPQYTCTGRSSWRSQIRGPQPLGHFLCQKPCSCPAKVPDNRYMSCQVAAAAPVAKIHKIFDKNGPYRCDPPAGEGYVCCH